MTGPVPGTQPQPSVTLATSSIHKGSGVVQRGLLRTTEDAPSPFMDLRSCRRSQDKTRNTHCSLHLSNHRNTSHSCCTVSRGSLKTGLLSRDGGRDNTCPQRHRARGSAGHRPGLSRCPRGAQTAYPSSGTATRLPGPGPTSGLLPASHHAGRPSWEHSSHGCRTEGCPCPRPAPQPLPIEAVPAGPVDAGVAAALVDLRQARGVMVALGATAGEAVDAVLTGAPVVTGAAGTLVDVDVAHAPYRPGRRGAQLPHPPLPRGPAGEVLASRFWPPSLFPALLNRG